METLIPIVLIAVMTIWPLGLMLAMMTKISKT